MDGPATWGFRSVNRRVQFGTTSKKSGESTWVASTVLGATPSRLLEDLNFMGRLFESLVIRDLRVYAQADDATVLQYHDSTGLEVDAIVEAADGVVVIPIGALGP